MTVTVNPERGHAPWNTVVNMGGSGEVPPAGRPWTSPGPPPGRRASQRPSGAVVWVGVGLAGAVLVGLCLVGTVAFWLAGGPQVVPSPSLDAGVLVGPASTCEKQIVGSYAMLASITLHNTGTDIERGTVWVKWPVTGDEPHTFSKEMELAAGDTVQFHVDEPIEGERWFRLGQCEYGWSPAG